MMLEKMSPNQRLILAVTLSFVFFMAYTTIFPPEVPEQADANTSAKTVSLKETEADAKPGSIPAKSEGMPKPAASEKPVTTTSSTLVTISTEHYDMEIDTLGRIASKIMKDAKFYNEQGEPSQMAPEMGRKTLELLFADEALQKAAEKTPYSTDVRTVNLAEGESVKVTMTQKLSDELTVTKVVTFQSNGHYNVDITLSQPTRYFVYLGQRPQVSEQMMTVRGAMVYQADGLTTIFEDGDVDGRTKFDNVQILSAFDQYYATLYYGLKPETPVYVERDHSDNPVCYFEAPEKETLTFNGYIGPKTHKVLESADPVLINAIEYGWFTFAAAPLFTLLQWLHDIFGNWGWAIIALTIIIRLVLYPLTHKGMMGMQKIKEIAPKIKEIQAKYKGDPQRMNAAVMEMYKKHGANPLGGCLPLLLQIPVFFAIYRLLLNAVELQGAEWILWINDLSRMDPYFILPLLMGASMYYQQKMTPSNFTDPLQEKIFKFLPVIFTFFFLYFPSGLVLYWFVNNLFSILQQVIVNKQFEAAKALRHEEHLAKKHKGGKDAEG
jgi:YidC/Oxa1 family membrane protein insertase